jgi:hypothetical protein
MLFTFYLAVVVHGTKHSLDELPQNLKNFKTYAVCGRNPLNTAVETMPVHVLHEHAGTDERLHDASSESFAFTTCSITMPVQYVSITPTEQRFAVMMPPV